MALSTKAVMVRRFFEDKDYLKLCDEICEAGMQDAIKEYLGERMLKHGRVDALDTLDITRLLDCRRIKQSDVLCGILDMALDRWAELAFRPGTNPLCGTMQEYLNLLSQMIPDAVHSWEITDSSTLRQATLCRHMYFLRCYLNKLSHRPLIAELWHSHFPKLFERDDKRHYLARVFLYGMLDEDMALMFHMESLEEEAQAVLVQCGYVYLIRTQNARWETETKMGFSIFSNVMERSIKKHFYLRPEHRGPFYEALPAYLSTCLYKELFDIMAYSEGALRDVICKLYEDLFSPKHPRPYPKRQLLEDLARLADAIPAEYMPVPRWENILDLVSRRNEALE